MPIKNNCFTAKEDGTCHALNETDCTRCKFYKHRKDIKDNPFYKYSWKNEEKMKEIIKKNGIKEEQIME